jgi:hypothetical protein
MSHSIAGADVLAHNHDVISADCNDELVLLRIESGRCYGMNKTGTSIWRRLATPMRVERLVGALQEEFRADPATSTPEIFDFLEHLRREGLIQRVDAPPADAAE